MGRFLLLAAVVTGCARAPIKPPEAQEFKLAGATAPVRDYTGVKVCNVPRGTIAEDAFAFNALLEKWLDQTSAAPDGVWAEEHLAMLEEGIRTLPPVLATQEAAINELATCRPDRKADVADVVARSQQLIPMARNRVEAGPKVVAEVRRRRAVEAWRTKEVATQDAERQNWCPPKPKGMPDVYYAWQDETGRLEWFFCDGSRVAAAPNTEPQHVPGPGYDAKKKGANKPEAFVKAAQKFPDSEIRRPPTGDAAPEQAAPEGTTPPATPEPAGSEASTPPPTGSGG